MAPGGSAAFTGTPYCTLSVIGTPARDARRHRKKVNRIHSRFARRGDPVDGARLRVRRPRPALAVAVRVDPGAGATRVVRSSGLRDLTFAVPASPPGLESSTGATALGAPRRTRCAGSRFCLFGSPTGTWSPRKRSARPRGAGCAPPPGCLDSNHRGDPDEGRKLHDPSASRTRTERPRDAQARRASHEDLHDAGRRRRRRGREEAGQRAGRVHGGDGRLPHRAPPPGARGRCMRSRTGTS